MTSENIAKLIVHQQRRLQKLKEQEARLGISTPPEILTEIEDIEIEIQTLKAEQSEFLREEAKSLEKQAENPKATKTVPALRTRPQEKTEDEVAVLLDLSAVGDDIKSGEIIAVLVNVGDRVTLDQAIFEVETEKATIEIPAPVSGRVTEIHVSEGDTVNVGAHVATIRS